MKTDKAKEDRSHVIPTSEELTQLIRESRRDKVLNVAMGSGRLLDTPGNDWAFQRLAEMRASQTH